MTRPKTLHRLPVAGGDYTVAEWPGRGPTLLAIHGITASHMAWPSVIQHLTADQRVLAPDLRGRGANGELPGPYGFPVHVDDLCATLDFFGEQRVVLVGHSLGAYIALAFAERYPDRVRGIVLVDGGLARPRPPGLTPEQTIKAVLGPALARLEMRFESVEAYRAFWQAHPAFQDPGAWNPEVQEYIDYDLVGTAPQLRSRVNAAPVMADAYALMEPEMVTLVDRVDIPMLLLTAPRGLLNQPEPLLPVAVVAEKVADVARLEHEEIGDTNHYTIVTGNGRARTAAAIERFVDARCPP